MRRASRREVLLAVRSEEPPPAAAPPPLADRPRPADRRSRHSAVADAAAAVLLAGTPDRRVRGRAAAGVHLADSALRRRKRCRARGDEPARRLQSRDDALRRGRRKRRRTRRGARRGRRSQGPRLPGAVQPQPGRDLPDPEPAQSIRPHGAAQGSSTGGGTCRSISPSVVTMGPSSSWSRSCHCW